MRKFRLNTNNMKIFFSFLFLISTIVSGQQYNRAVYDIEINRDKFENKLKENPFPGFEKMLIMLDDANNSKLILHFDDKISRCSVKEQLPIGRNVSGAKAMLNFLKAAQDTYYNSKTSVYAEKRGSGNLEHLAQIETICFEWNILGETKTINGLKYRKATTTFILKEQKHYVVAWFTSEIPVQFGPSFFNSLPGLITEVYVTSNESHIEYNYILNKLDFDKKMGDISLPEEKYNLITEDESEDIFRKANSRFRNAINN